MESLAVILILFLGACLALPFTAAPGPAAVRSPFNVTGIQNFTHDFFVESHRAPRALPQKASYDAVRFQPVLDYDTDSCYNVPAIDAKGKVSEGLENAYESNTSGGCRRPEHLDNQNVYVRRRCNHGWCAYM